MFFKIIQTWCHIENKTIPSNGIIFTEATDIYTDQQFIYYSIEEFFVGLKVKNRYNDKELTTFQRKNFIQINLGDLKENWPSANMFDENIRHIKIEIQYTNIKPLFEDSFPRTGYINSYIVDGIIQPEFVITVPLGMKIRDDGENIRLLLTKEEGEDVILHKAGVDIEHVDGKNSYHILIRDDSFNKIRSIHSKEAWYNRILVNYNVTNQSKFWFFPVFPTLLLVFGIIEYFYAPNYLKVPDVFVLSLTYVIIFITFLTFYLTLNRDGYEIPYNRFTQAITVISAIVLSIPQLIPILVNNVISPLFSLTMALIIPIILFVFILFCFVSIKKIFQVKLGISKKVKEYFLRKYSKYTIS